MIREAIENNIKSYVNMILCKWEKNPKVCELLNKIYFNSKYDFRDIFRLSIIKNFSDCQIDPTVSIELCKAEALVGFDISFLQVNTLDKYSIFNYKVFNTYQEAAQNYPSNYYFVQSAFMQELDEFLFSHLTDYNRTADGFYEKQISNTLKIEFDLNAEREINSNIYDYVFPSHWLSKKGERVFQRSDLRTLLFIDGRSFFAFFTWCNNIKYDEKGGVREIVLRDDEPVIYHIEDDQKYIITNSYDKLEHWNNYIRSLVGLFVYHFRIYEKWLLAIFSE